MAKKASKKAVGYIRGAVWRTGWAPDSGMQGGLISKYMNDKKFEKIALKGEVQKFTKTTRNPNKVLNELIEICEKENADFIFCDIGYFRRNQYFNNVVYQRSLLKKKSWKFIQLPQSNRIIDAIRRFNKARRKEIVKHSIANPKPEDKPQFRYVSPITKWQDRWDISETKKKNYTHLVHGEYSICDVILEHAEKGLSNYRIAWELNDLLYRTPTGMEWTDESVRKLRNMMAGKYEHDRGPKRKGDHFLSFMEAWLSKPTVS
ncbi:MAG: hypothetical protein HOL66_09185 [Rhodospirillaceae bacterium]|nr:hypothetical protein [Rhodospirillaceae bacterium]MBT5244408.1 hypothetical protein [Rhodospirillaceae bacterium]MBT5562282.1 hypothetical protein [Rhodospirillaceae bacterium]MBT6240717.1 hypothetical protein [Rhodospirillaceae bacterium]